MTDREAGRGAGRRAEGKRQKFERITAAASALFAERGVSDVTTQEIADAADIAAGTLFLYAKSKGELLLLVQNLDYADAVARGRLAAAAASNPLDAVMAHLRPVVECNRKQIENGRTYLREMLFGDSSEPHHAEAVRIAMDSEHGIAQTLRMSPRVTPDRAPHLARAISAVLFLALSDSAAASATTEELLRLLRDQVDALI